MNIKTTASSGYHNLDEYSFYTGISKRELFILLREKSLEESKDNNESTWVDEAIKDIEVLKKHGIK